MAVKVNGAFTGGVVGAGAGVVYADKLALITMNALGWIGTMQPEVYDAWIAVLTGGYGLILTGSLAAISKFVAPYLLEKGDEVRSRVVPGA